jgi:hypothetical protein
MPRLSGISLHADQDSLPGIAAIRHHASSSDYVRAALEAGGTGYVLKSAVVKSFWMRFRAS